MHDEMGHEPAYKQFSFCPKVKCMKDGMDKLTKKGIEFPVFEGIIGVKESTSSSILEETAKELLGFAKLESSSEFLREDDHYILRHE
jgi:hypothetical protein